MGEARGGGGHLTNTATMRCKNCVYDLAGRYSYLYRSIHILVHTYVQPYMTRAYELDLFIRLPIYFISYILPSLADNCNTAKFIYITNCIDYIRYTLLYTHNYVRTSRYITIWLYSETYGRHSNKNSNAK